MQCICGHGFEQHHEGGRCRVQVLSGWDTGTNYFAKATACTCGVYRGDTPTTAVAEPNDCMHDYIKGNPRCLYCHAAKVTAK